MEEDQDDTVINILVIETDRMDMRKYCKFIQTVLLFFVALSVTTLFFKAYQIFPPLVTKFESSLIDVRQHVSSIDTSISEINKKIPKWL